MSSLTRLCFYQNPAAQQLTHPIIQHTRKVVAVSDFCQLSLNLSLILGYGRKNLSITMNLLSFQEWLRVPKSKCSMMEQDHEHQFLVALRAVTLFSYNPHRR